VTSAALLVVAGLISLRRDIGVGLIRTSDTTAPRLGLLSSPTAQALRGERGSLIAWLVGTGVFAFVVGAISDSVSSAGVSEGLERRLEKLGGASVSSPTGYVSFSFLFFVLAISLFACSQIAALRHEESEQRLETLLALPVGRGSWLLGRWALAILGTAALAAVAALLTWAGAVSEGAGITLPDMLAA
jgi:ABC-2 type transport system permease protein